MVLGRIILTNSWFLLGCCQVREVCLGENGILEPAGAGAVVIDMSSIDPIESKAIDGTLSVMAGGEKEDFDKYYDLLMAIAGSVV